MRDVLSQIAPMPTPEMMRSGRMKALIDALDSPGKSRTDPRVVALRKIGALKYLREILGDDLPENDGKSKVMELLRECRKSL